MDGTPFGRYRLIELLGRGGMGEVWRALDPATDRIVAIKVLPANFADDQVFQERFRREARAAAGLNDPHVVPIHYFGEIEGRLYVDMRLINGRDLQELLDDGPLAPARAVGIIEQIASALEAAHEVGLVHRDVKPSNILVAADDFAYLIDFGIARIAGETGLTSTGATIGTWAYMAPERFRKGIADARTDIYALACVLYQSLTGQLPFRGDTLEQIAVAHLMDPPPKPSLARDGVPPELDQVIATGMAKYPERRYPTSKDLAQAARAALTTPVPHLSPPGPPPTATPPSSGEGRPDGETTRAAAESTGIQESPTDGMPAFSRGAGTGETTTQTAPTESVGNAPTQYAPNNGHDNMSRRPGRTAAVVVSVVGALAVIATGVALWVSQRKSPAPQAPSSSSSSEAAPALSPSFGPSPPSESAPAPVPVPVPSDSASTQITYTVTGTKAPGDIVSVSFVDSTGTTRTQRNIAIPWSYTLTLASPPKVGSLQASSLFKMSTLNCSITTADGTVLSATRDNSPVVSC